MTAGATRSDDLEVCRRLREAGLQGDRVTREVCLLLGEGLTLGEAAVAIEMSPEELEARWDLWRVAFGLS